MNFRLLPLRTIPSVPKFSFYLFYNPFYPREFLCVVIRERVHEVLRLQPPYLQSFLH